MVLEPRRWGVWTHHVTLSLTKRYNAW